MSYKSKAAWTVGIVIGILVLSLAVYGAMGIDSRRGESQYTGVVVDVVEDKGVVFTPSWVNMKTDSRSSDIQQYCITPDAESDLIPRFYEAMEKGDRVTVTYQRPLWVAPSDCAGGQAIITDIHPVNESSA